MTEQINYRRIKVCLCTNCKETINPKTKTCPYCHSNNGEENIYKKEGFTCEYCRHLVEKNMIFCPNCKNVLVGIITEEDLLEEEYQKLTSNLYLDKEEKEIVCGFRDTHNSSCLNPIDLTKVSCVSCGERYSIEEAVSVLIKTKHYLSLEDFIKKVKNYL